jgi:hypothetical protein
VFLYLLHTHQPHCRGPDQCSQNTLLPSSYESNTNRSLACVTCNYRPIAVPEPLMRLYASVIDSRLVGYLEREGLRCDAQAGFRPGLSTLHNILTLQHFIDRSSASQPLYCCFLDLSKAYDRVPRTLLWGVLRRWGVGGSFSQAIRSLYDGAQLTMDIEGTSGPIHPATVGLT